MPVPFSDSVFGHGDITVKVKPVRTMARDFDNSLPFPRCCVCPLLCYSLLADMTILLTWAKNL